MGTPPSMTPERWRQVTAIFHEAVDKDAAASLRVEVDAMLAAHRYAGQFGEVPLVLTPSTTRGSPIKSRNSAPSRAARPSRGREPR
jgi:hypothetical protein